MSELTTRFKFWGQKLLLIVAGVIAGYLSIEIFAISTGFAVPPDSRDFKFFYEFVQPDTQLGYEPKPNLNNLKFQSPFSEFSTIENTDSYGFRNQGRDYTKSNLYFVGDSFTWGYGVNREESFYGILESEIIESLASVAKVLAKLAAWDIISETVLCYTAQRSSPKTFCYLRPTKNAEIIDSIGEHS